MTDVNDKLLIVSFFWFLLLCLPLSLQAQDADIEALEKKAYKGDPEACYQMGQYYQKKSETDKRWDFFAEKFYSDGAQKGHVRAIVEYAKILEKKRMAQHIYFWYQKAALQGDAEAIYGMANCALNGWGVWPKDAPGACYLYHLSAALGFSEGRHRYEELKSQGILENKQLYLKAIQGDAEAQRLLADKYADGDGVGKDATMAYFLYKPSAEKGNVHAMYGMGILYAKGSDHIRANGKLATEWLDKAKAIGCVECSRKVALMYRSAQNFTQAYGYYLYAANNGDTFAQGMVGLCMSRKSCEYYNLEGARVWLKKAIAAGHKEFEKNLIQDVEYPLHQQALANSPVKEIKQGESDVDQNVFSTSQDNDKTFAIIIANEKYENVQEVPFAHNDGERMAEYCLKTLGMPTGNVKLVKDATRNDIKFNINWAREIMKAYKGEARMLFYYAGHGIPDEASHEGYLLPVDALGSDINTAYSLHDLYDALNSLPAKNTLVLLDACFSGSLRNGEMMDKARGVAIKAKATLPLGNMVVMSAASGEQTAAPFEANKHGMFTYYILKKLQESKGETTFGELSDYVTKRVKQSSLVENQKLQTPTTQSALAEETWRQFKLK